MLFLSSRGGFAWPPLLKKSKMILIVTLVVLFGLIILMRAFGSWMLRIDDIIDLQRKTLEELKKKQ